MAEAHPVGFQWVMEAKLRGAKVIHVDPRFSRTSAMADLHVPIRAGSDIAFLGGVINYILSNGREFREYVTAFTNAPVILRDDFKDTEDLDGLFSGYNPDTGRYDPSSWMYEGMDVPSGMGERVKVSHAAAGEAYGSGGATLSHGHPPAASWRCAVTPRSRARPTSPRSTTCCPATCRCRTPVITRRSRTTWTTCACRPASSARSTTTRSACSRPTSATRPPPTTTSASATCPSSPATTRSSRR